MCRSDTQQPTTAPSSTPVEPLTAETLSRVRLWHRQSDGARVGSQFCQMCYDRWPCWPAQMVSSLDAAVARAEAAERRAGVIRAGKLAAMGVAADTEEAYFKLKAANADLSRQLAEARLGREQDAQAQLERTALLMADVDNAERRATVAEAALAEARREVG